MSPMRIKNQQDLLAGLFFVVVSALGLWISRNYTMGFAREMAEGYMPRLLLWILLGLGLVIMIRGLVVSGESVGKWVYRPMVMVVVAFLAFGTIERLGIIVASVLLVVLGSHAGRDIRYKELAVASVGLAVAAALVFVWLVGLPIKIWPW